MGALGLFGALLLVFGPAAVLFRAVAAGKPLFVLAVLLSAAAYLLSLLVAALPFRASYLANSSSVFPALLVALVVQEGATRPLIWHGSKRALAALNGVAREQRMRPATRFDTLFLALSCGLGHGISHAAFFALPLLSLSASAATLRMDRCPQMSLFGMTAACTCAMVLLHAAAMPVAFYGWSTQHRFYSAAPAGLHFLAALASLSSLAPGGCVATVVLLWLLASVQVLVAGSVALAVTARQ